MKKLSLTLLIFIGGFLMITSCTDQAVNPANEDQVSNDWDVSAWADLANEVLEEQRQFIQIVSGPITGNAVWDANTIWVLNGPVFVTDGSSLTIEPGTVVKAFPGQTFRSSYLVVARGGQLFANGSVDAPVIFTSLADRVAPGDEGTFSSLPAGVRGLWGGLLLLGDAPSNSLPGQNFIEGIPVGGPVPSEFGGMDTTDNSGVLNYVSIRFGGTEIGDGNEINGCTFGSVGNGTTVDFVEVISNRDDAFEWFGGTVICDHIIGSFSGDDIFDWDQGFFGGGQFWFSFQAIVGDRAGEHDGGLGDAECDAPFSTPQIANVTYVGGGGNDLGQMRDNTGGHYARSIFTNFGIGWEIEDRRDLLPGCGSQERLAAGDLTFSDVLFYNVGNGTTDDAFQFVRDSVDAILDPGASSDPSGSITGVIVGSGATNDPLFNENFVPSSGIVSGFPADTTDAFDDVSYLGAFEPGIAAPWTTGWTLWSVRFGNPGGNLGPGTGQESPDPNP